MTKQSLPAAREDNPRNYLKEQTKFKKTGLDCASSKLSYTTTSGSCRSSSLTSKLTDLRCWRGVCSWKERRERATTCRSTPAAPWWGAATQTWPSLLAARFSSPLLPDAFTCSLRLLRTPHRTLAPEWAKGSSVHNKVGRRASPASNCLWSSACACHLTTPGP